MIISQGNPRSVGFPGFQENLNEFNQEANAVKQESKLYSYHLVFPALTVYTLLFIVPMVIGLYFSLTDWRVGKEVINFIGLENFKFIFHDGELRQAVINTVIYSVVVVIFKNGLGLLLALAVNVKMRGRNLLRGIYYLPAVISAIVIGLVFTRILHPEGTLNTFLSMIGLGVLAQDWLIDPHIIMTVIAGVSVWQWTGYHMAIYLAGLQSIPSDCYEAAAIDGVTAVQRFRYITLPLLAPSININVMLSLIGGIRGFSEVYALTGGGPGNISQVLTTEVLKRFGEGSWGLGTALNTVLLVTVGLICIPLLRKMRQLEVEE